MIELQLFGYAMAALWTLIVLAVALALVERSRELVRIRKARQDNSLEFGAVGGPRFERCTTCGHVRHG